MVADNTHRLCISVKRHSTIGLLVAALCLLSSEITFTIGMAAVLWGAHSIVSMKPADFASSPHVYSPSDMRTLLERFESEQISATSVHTAFDRAFRPRPV